MAECAVMTATLLEALASTLMKDPVTGDTFFNVMCYDKDCAEYAPALACGENTGDNEATIVALGFGVDSCGYPAIKLRVCVAADAEGREQ